MAPLTRSRARQPGNVPTPLNACYYAQRASAALIISEATQVSMQDQGYAWTPGAHSREQVEGWRLVTDAVHEEGGRIFLQLWHVGWPQTNTAATSLRAACRSIIWLVKNFTSATRYWKARRVGTLSITPLLSMIEVLQRDKGSFELHYCSRTPESTAFLSELAPLAERGVVSHYFSRIASPRRLDIAGLLARIRADSQIYCCGPRALIDAVTSAGAVVGLTGRLNVEFFGSAPSSGQAVYKVRSGRVIPVAPHLGTQNGPGRHGLGAAQDLPNLVRVQFVVGRLVHQLALSCVVRDYSYEGARIVIFDPINVPNEVELHIPDRNRLVHATVRWRHGNKIGLAFSEARFASGKARSAERLHARL
jgi:hypothetical protein